MAITDETIELLRKEMEKQSEAEVSSEDAKRRLVELLNLFWILCHRAPEEGEGPYDLPPPPSWF